MEYRIIKILSIVITLTAVIGLVILVAVPGLHSYALSQKQEEKRRQSVLSLMQNSKNLTIQENSKMQGQIRLTLPKGMKQEDMIVQADPVECGLSITIPGISEYYFYDYPMVGSAQHVENLYFDTDASGGTIQFELDQGQDKDDDRQKYNEQSSENIPPHAVKHRQVSERAESVPHRHKHKENRKQVTYQPLFSAYKKREHRKYRPQKDISVLQKLSHF